MRIILERVEPFETAFERLRGAPLEKAGDTEILIYRDAKISLAKFYATEMTLRAAKQRGIKGIFSTRFARSKNIVRASSRTHPW